MADYQEEPSWYAKRGEKEIGPLGLSKLQDLANTGRIKMSDMVRSSTGSQWKLASNIIHFPEADRSKSLRPPLPPPLGFFHYCWSSYARTHTALPWLFAIILGIILVPALSFSKPRLGLQFIWTWSVVTVVLSILAFAVLLMAACINFLFRRQRQVPEGHTTWLSAMACFFFTLSVALGICGVAETFGSSKGIVVTLLPQLQKEQNRFFSNAVDQQLRPDSIPSNSETGQPLENPRQPLESPEQPLENPEQPLESPEPQKNIPSKSPEIIFQDDDVDRTSSANRQEIIEPNAALSTATTQDVVAEGIGSTADEAIRDAYRNAVQQVVGAVVDAETLIENDEIISDKVLTYSDGFIKTSSEIPGSKKVQNGLHRIVITARVERRSVIAQLKAANVTIKTFDGEGLFAEAITKMDAERSAFEILDKQFQAFPGSLLSAKVIGAPELIEKSSGNATVQIKVRLETDLVAYKAFASRLQTLLEGMATDRGQFTAVFKSYNQNGLYASIDDLAEWMPKSFGGSKSLPQLNPEQITLALTKSSSQSGDRLECRYFLLDKAIQPLLAKLTSRAGEGKVTLLNKNGESVVTDRFALHCSSNSSDFDSTLVSPIGAAGRTAYVFSRESDVYSIKDASMFWVNSVFLAKGTNRLQSKPFLEFSRVVNLSLDELKLIEQVKAEVSFGE